MMRWIISSDDFVFEKLSSRPVNGCHIVSPDSLHLRDHSFTVPPEERFTDEGGAVGVSALSVGITPEALHQSGEDIS